MSRNTVIQILFLGCIASLTIAGCSGHTAGVLPQSAVTDTTPNMATNPSVAPMQIGDTTQSTASTAYLSLSANVLPAGYTPNDGIDKYTSSFKWVTTQSASYGRTLQASGVYTDMYISSIRETALDSYPSQPAYSTANVHEDAFEHSADPAYLTYSPHSGYVTLNWHPDARGIAISGYNVYRGSSSSTLSRVATLTASATSYNLTSLANGRTYYTTIRTVINRAEVPFSWTLPVIAGTSSSHLDSPKVSVSGTIAPGYTVTLTVSAHVSGPLPSAMRLQTIVKPVSTTSTPASVTMSYIGSGVYRGSARAAIPSGFYGGVAYRVVATTGGQLPYPSGTYYITSPNNRIHFGRYPHNYIGNPASSAWQSLLSRTLTEHMLAGGYGGVLLDDCDNVFFRVRPDAYPPGYSDAAYPGHVANLFSYLRATVPSTYALGANGFASPTIASALGPYVKRAEVEEFAADFAGGGGGYDSPAYWPISMNNVLNIQRAFPSLRLRLVTIGKENYTSLRSYGLANYLLVANAHTDYDYDSVMGGWWPESDVILGTPTQTFTNISQAYDSSWRAYVRKFYYGMVIVNPSPYSLRTIYLPSGYRQVVIRGGDKQDGGYITLSSVSSVTLGAYQGVVLIKI